MPELEPHARVSRLGAGIGSIVCQAHRYTNRGRSLAGFALPFSQDSGNRDNGGRAWLREHTTGRSRSSWCGAYKVAAKDRGLTYREALDDALCFGWIDGVRRSADDQSFSTRFTPRKPKSIWSAVNIRRARQLEAEGRMQPAGRAAFAAREARNSQRYSFEPKPRKLAPRHQKKLRANERAWSFFRAQAQWYQRTSIFWVMEAKRFVRLLLRAVARLR